MVKKAKKFLFPKKALISIYLPKEKIWITGQGSVDCTKNPQGEFVFTTYMKKNYGK